MFEQKINNLIEKRMPRAIGGQNGYTLIEIVMVIVILGVIGAFTFQFVAHGVLAFKKSSARKDLYDQGRLALERMVRSPSKRPIQLRPPITLKRSNLSLSGQI
jgi:prepilin-type N-terminal cleavage/methylation domain-containing protein